ncbi:hypothetical protein Cfor_03200 [Coptotermes formosanus]|uniref:CHK kinase-like domain-containing protein n=1 Tax=Coptotermes formosanus TaxID=36987 RepID=A0A6L2PK91_COPFO|nr:hypothetical protein Cfor_03200 [Coptotermes formosanus]
MDGALWIQQKLVPTMVAHGSFGKGSKQLVETTKCNVVYKAAGDDHFTSTILFINLELTFENQEPEVHSLLVKVSPEHPIYRKYVDTDALFHNERLMYMEFIPLVEEFLRNRQVDLLRELFAKCYYAESCAAYVDRSDIIVLEDMVPRGFTTSAERLVLDYEHCAVALRQLARYHALSYGMKNLEPSRFHAMVRKIRANNSVNSSSEYAKYFWKPTSYRAVKYLEGRQEMDQVTLDRLKDRLEDAGQLLMDLLAPKEPLAVLCHGDFCRNNILFRYVSGKPCDAIFFDFQTVKYASPAIDLSFFMYLNTSSELRSQHWDDLFGEYHATLIGTLAHILGCSVEELLQDYGLEAFQKEFVDHGFYGYMICSFFLPQMLADRKDRIDHAILFEKTLDEVGSVYAGYGGESASRHLADILKHLALLGAL